MAAASRHRSTSAVRLDGSVQIAAPPPPWSGRRGLLAAEMRFPPAVAELDALLTILRREAALSDLGVLVIDAEAAAAPLSRALNALDGQIVICDPLAGATAAGLRCSSRFDTLRPRNSAAPGKRRSAARRSRSPANSISDSPTSSRSAPRRAPARRRPRPLC